MADSPTPLRHADSEKADDAALAQEAQSFIAKTPAVQLVAEVLAKLRTLAPPWWSQEFVRDTWPAAARMTWLRERADVRQKITTGLTGLAPKAARNKAPDFQASLIDSVIEDGDVTVSQFEEAFEIGDLAVYGPIVEFWQRFRERFPWDQDSPPNQEFMAWLFEAFLSSQSSIGGHTRKPVLTSLALRTAIPGKTWHTRIPLEVRVAIDDLRFQREKAKPGDPFHAIHDLSVATPAIICSNVPLRDLARVVDAAERSMGFPASPPAPRTTSGPASTASTGGGAPAASASAASSASSAPTGASGGGPSAGPPPPPPGSAPAGGASPSQAPRPPGAPPPPPPAVTKTDAPTGEAPTTRRGAEEDFAFDDDPDDTAAETDKSRRKREQIAQAKR